MPAETTALISPSSSELPLLFEASRILGRRLEASEALESLLSLLESHFPLSGGLAAARSPGCPDFLFVAVSGPQDAAILGRRLDMGAAPPAAALPPEAADLARAMSLTLERGSAYSVGGLLAFPALVGEEVIAILGFRLVPPGAGNSGATAPAMPFPAVVEAVLALYSEAWSLRARLAERLSGDSRRERPEGWEGFLQAKARAREDGGGALAAMVGNSPSMDELKALISRVAPTDSTVLVTGESGTGKELAARAVHALSGRAEGPFVALNCAALPESLLESELFGHEKGAFTGAQARRLGRFELATGGTIFLDEVAELAAPLQAKLLRVLQERSFERVGGTRTVRADVRVVAATNRDLEAEVASGRFRADLYWRLAVFPLKMPPLRERGADLVLLADLFTEKYAARLKRPVSRISTPALDLLTSYHWPGNVRELENVIERAVILSTDGVIHAYHLPPSLQSADSTGTGPASTLDAALARLERELLVEALKMEGGNAAAAARRLGVSERRMGLALKRYGIDWRRFRARPEGGTGPTSA